MVWCKALNRNETIWSEVGRNETKLFFVSSFNSVSLGLIKWIGFCFTQLHVAYLFYDCHAHTFTFVRYHAVARSVGGDWGSCYYRLFANEIINAVLRCIYILIIVKVKHTTLKTVQGLCNILWLLSCRSLSSGRVSATQVHDVYTFQ